MMGMPFGMIFAIFLIVVFVVIAFIAVGYFLDIGRSANVGDFYRDLQDSVDDAWGQSSGEFDFEISLPSGVERVCFGNLSERITNRGVEYDEIKTLDVYDANVFLYPRAEAEGMDWKLIEHINISLITEIDNPYCVDADGELLISKGFYDRQVLIS